MRGKFHVIWITNDDNNKLIVGFSESEDQIKETASRYRRPKTHSAIRLRNILNQSREVPFLVLHATGPSVTYYLPRRPRNPAPAHSQRLAIAA
jgi:hypothetical protein